MTDAEVNKRLCELLGIAYPTDDPRQQFYVRSVCIAKSKMDIPEFQSEKGRIDLLRRMREKFYYWLWNSILEKHDGYDPLKYFVIEYMADDHGALAGACLEFLEGERDE